MKIITLSALFLFGAGLLPAFAGDADSSYFKFVSELDLSQAGPEMPAVPLAEPADDRLLKGVPPPAQGDPIWFVEGLTAQKQEKKFWCVAASGRMLMSKTMSGNLPRQCEIAARVHGEDCCRKNSIRCEQALDPVKTANAFGFKTYRREPNFEETVSLVRAGKPVMINHFNAQGTADYSGHAVVAYGAYRKNNRNYVIIYDPYTNSKKYWSSDYLVGNLKWYGTYTFTK
jgi:hypothetical protein